MGKLAQEIGREHPALAAYPTLRVLRRKLTHTPKRLSKARRQALWRERTKLLVVLIEAYQHDYPKSEYAADVSHKLATAYVAAGRSAQAAAAFERIAANPKEDPAVVHEAVKATVAAAREP